MKRFVITAITAGAMGVTGMGLAGVAQAATPSVPSSSTSTVRQLEGNGYEVIVTKVGTNAQHCSISSVRPGHTMMGKSKEIRGVQTPTVLHKTMFVDLRC